MITAFLCLLEFGSGRPQVHWVATSDKKSPPKASDSTNHSFTNPFAATVQPLQLCPLLLLNCLHQPPSAGFLSSNHCYQWHLVYFTGFSNWNNTETNIVSPLLCVPIECLHTVCKSTERLLHLFCVVSTCGGF